VAHDVQGAKPQSGAACVDPSLGARLPGLAKKMNSHEAVREEIIKAVDEQSLG